jgi:hypothetical protein
MSESERRGVFRVATVGLTLGSGVAFGVGAMSGVVAAIIFPTVRDLNPSLPDFAAHRAPHGPILAGIVAERVFMVSFAVVGVALGVALLSAVALTLNRRRASVPVLRLGLTLVACGLFAVHAAWLQPRMNSAATAYREAARSGDSQTASEAKARFDAMHPTASRLIGATTLASLGLFVASAWLGAAPRPTGRSEAK